MKYGGRTVFLDKQDVIGEGGEAIVFGQGKHAIKIYKRPTRLRAEKLKFLLSKNWPLPKDKVVLATDLVEDMNGNIVGLVMDKLSSSFEELASLSNRRFRRSHNITSERITKLFIDGAHTLQTIHNAGIVVGDMNDRNELFRANDMIFLEPDGMQVGSFPCLVATEQFVDPQLYGVDLSRQGSKPVFEANMDWYSYAVLFFKSLLMVHPYGGVHSQFPKLTQRAMNKVTVFDTGVIYPKIAEDPNILTPDLRNVFDEYFKRDWRGPFPVVVLEHFLSTITGKPIVQTGFTIPTTRQVAVDGVITEQIIATTGVILFSKVVGDIFYVVAKEGEYVYLYSYKLGETAKKIALFKSSEVVNAKYEVFGNYLAVGLGKGENSKILIFKIQDKSISHVATSSADGFSINGRPMFKASSTHFYRIVGGMLMEGSFEFGQFVERVVRPVNQNQTWFTVNPYHQSKSAEIFGFFQVLADQMYWYVHDGNNYNVSLTRLLDKEVLRDISVRFSSQGAMIRRHTAKDGIDYIRIDIIDEQGDVIFQKLEKKNDYELGIHGIAYSTGKALHATDNGVVQEDLLNNSTKTFANTKNYLAAGFALEKFGEGLAVVTDQQVVLLQLQ